MTDPLEKINDIFSNLLAQRDELLVALKYAKSEMTACSYGHNTFERLHKVIKATQTTIDMIEAQMGINEN